MSISRRKCSRSACRPNRRQRNCRKNAINRICPLSRERRPHDSHPQLYRVKPKTWRSLHARICLRWQTQSRGATRTRQISRQCRVNLSSPSRSDVALTGPPPTILALKILSMRQCRASLSQAASLTSLPVCPRRQQWALISRSSLRQTRCRRRRIHRACKSRGARKSVVSIKRSWPSTRRSLRSETS